jgi:hypothetical protein
VVEDGELRALAPDGAQEHTRRMPSSHGKQKQAEKQKKKRELARRSAVRTTPAAPSTASILREAMLMPRGPTWITSSWKRAGAPELVTVLATRKAPGGIFLPGIALVDRTCLGIKNGFVATPVGAAQLSTMVARLGEAHQEVMEPCDVLIAQSVLYHAIDYARSLGFEPHRDFPEPIFGPRPEALLDTPFARPARPIYVSGPDDDVRRVLARLEAAVGPGGFDLVGAVSGSGSDMIEDDADEP